MDKKPEQLQYFKITKADCDIVKLEENDKKNKKSNYITNNHSSLTENNIKSTQEDNKLEKTSSYENINTNIDIKKTKSVGNFNFYFENNDISSCNDSFMKDFVIKNEETNIKDTINNNNIIEDAKKIFNLISKIESLRNMNCDVNIIQDIIINKDKIEHIKVEEKKRIPWTQNDDNLLKEIMNKVNENSSSKKNFVINWKLIESCINVLYFQKRIDHLRSGKQCRERWINHLEDKVKKDSWTKDEEEILFKITKEKGHKWSEISKYLKGRTDNCVKNHYYSNLRKKVRRLIKYSDWINSDQYTKIKEDLEKVFPIPTNNKANDKVLNISKINCEQIYKMLKIIDVSYVDIDEKLLLFLFHIINYLNISPKSNLNGFESNIFENYKKFENHFSLNKSDENNTKIKIEANLFNINPNSNKDKTIFFSHKSNSFNTNKFQNYDKNSINSKFRDINSNTFSFNSNKQNCGIFQIPQNSSMPYNPYNNSIGTNLFFSENMNLSLKENNIFNDNSNFYILNEDRRDKSINGITGFSGFTGINNINTLIDPPDYESINNCNYSELDFDKKIESKNITNDFKINNEDKSQYNGSYKLTNQNNNDLNNFLKFSETNRQQVSNNQDFAQNYFHNINLGLKRNKSDEIPNNDKCRIIKSNEILEQLAKISNPEKNNTITKSNVINNLDQICNNNKVNTTYLRDIVKEEETNDDLSLIKNFILKEKTKSIIISDNVLVSNSDPLTNSSNDKNSIGILINKKINENEIKKVVFYENTINQEELNENLFKFERSPSKIVINSNDNKFENRNREFTNKDKRNKIPQNFIPVNKEK